MPRVGHGFSTREGGVSRLEHTKTMNLSFGLGDEDLVVLENMKILCANAGVSYDGLVGSPQFHSSVVRVVGVEDAHEGIEKENKKASDGFVTDCKGMSLIVRMADCTPILLVGQKEDASPVVGAVHAGWRGTVCNIGGKAVYEMISLGAKKASIKVAIGQCIHSCCFEVKEDFVEAVTKEAGAVFAKRFIEERQGRLYCDLVAMNVSLLLEAGISEKNIDICPECTACKPLEFHSHRATGGKRGTMGAIIGISR